MRIRPWWNAALRARRFQPGLRGPERTEEDKMTYYESAHRYGLIAIFFAAAVPALTDPVQRKLATRASAYVENRQ